MPISPNHRSWHHGPLHVVSDEGTYMVTAGTYRKEPFFHGERRLSFLCDSIFSVATEFKWGLRAWAIFPNHYHFIADSAENSKSLARLISKLHMTTAKALNTADSTSGRKVWDQYWDVRIDFQRSYFARLRYVMNNPVKHGVVTTASQYRWCSALWFEENAERSFVRTVAMFPTDKLSLDDDF